METTVVKERPVLFSDPMVCAILSGAKTQTRRIVKPQPDDDESLEVGLYHPEVVDRQGFLQPGDEVFGAYSLYGNAGWVCPYGKPGDRLWVREAWCVSCRSKDRDRELYLAYRSTGHISNSEAHRRFHDDPDFGKCYLWEEARRVSKAVWKKVDQSWGKKGWTPSIFMPRWASRIFLEITEVRVERLRSISKADAVAEGTTGIPAFASLWAKINGEASLTANPWVWAITFKRLENTTGSASL